MPQSDPDERLLAALRGERVIGDSPAEASELRAANRIGAAARRARDLLEEDPEQIELVPPTMTFPGDEIERGVESSDASGGEAIPLRRRRISVWLPTAVAAAIAIIAGTALFVTNDTSERVAVLQLDPLTEQGTASAELINDDGRYELRVAVEGIAPDGGYLELWLINSDVTELVSFGPVEDNGTYILPSGLDPAKFPVVDVSIEPLDGNPAHSGNSVFRGTFSL